MPQGMGTYGSKVGRPPKKKAHGGKVVKKMRMAGSVCKGMGKAVRGGKFSRNG